MEALYGSNKNEHALALQACKHNKVNIVAKQALAFFAATQLLVAPIAGVKLDLVLFDAGQTKATEFWRDYAGPALAVDAPDAKGALESIKDALPNPFFGRSDKVNQGPTVCD